MPERFYTSAGDGKLEALEETPFPTEDELQALTALHPPARSGLCLSRSARDSSGDKRRLSAGNNPEAQEVRR